MANKDEDVRVGDAMALLGQQPTISEAFKTFLSMVLAQQHSQTPVVATSSSVPRRSSAQDDQQQQQNTGDAQPAESQQQQQQQQQQERQQQEHVGVKEMPLSRASLPHLQVLIRETLRGCSSFDLARLQRVQGKDETGSAFLDSLGRLRAVQHVCQLLENKQQRRTRWLGSKYFELVWPLIQEDLRESEAIASAAMQPELVDAYIAAVTAALADAEKSAMWSPSLEAHLQEQAQKRREQAAALATEVAQMALDADDDDDDADEGEGGEDGRA
ncbi:hypothetical protein PTSG_07095 [Salpingoeca rosetta]|uniref:Uncharacterized protein n=1 Tax=Salpingoeca rosetta (strain ATCC 50818 / BSB-021) TaxID=946362 RepID=F2UE16_SALR5|nr:uncharacterized protein PTSG_07095 [Salpingoeca rosetta]EGD74866.1 hypothetical protein PTSG_07095 [Salpingoeca rosetta]|eukprot:XP_004992511.1 hypothetical protein PTSG_07095 [Salpingoeca rosetta]